MKSYNPNKLKKPALIIVISLLTAVVLLTGCSSPDQKIENAEANWEYQADMNQYRKEAADRIAANDSTIAVFKARMANETAEVKAAYEKQLAVLEQKNSDMKEKLADYNGEGKEQWETFKASFNREMNSLGEAFEDLADTNL